MTITLRKEQRAVIPWALRALRREGCVLFADAPGFGKSYQALGVVEAAGGTPVVIAPRALHGMWRSYLARAGKGITLYSYGELRRTPERLAETREGRILIVDEAHAFVNPRAQQSVGLARAIAGLPTIFLSATPYQNHARDLLQILAHRSSWAHWLLQQQMFEGEEVEHLLTQVCRRRAVRHHRVVTRRSYTQTAELEGVQGAAEAMAMGDPALSALLFHGLLSRRLSSFEAWEASLAEGRRYLEEGLAHAEEGRVLSRRAYRRDLQGGQRAFGFLQPWAAADTGAEATADAHAAGGDAASGDAAHAAGGDSADAHAAGDLVSPRPSNRAASELNVAMPSHAADAHTTADYREGLRGLDEAAARVAELRRASGAATWRWLLALPRPLVLFSTYRTTVDAIYRALRSQARVIRWTGAGIDANFPWRGDGPLPPLRAAPTEGWHPAPRAIHPDAAKRASTAGAREGTTYDAILVATDVAAEGVDLSEARALVHLDLHWNPMTTLQREGRVLRGETREPAEIYAPVYPEAVDGAWRLSSLRQEKQARFRRWSAHSEARDASTATRADTGDATATHASTAPDRADDACAEQSETTATVTEGWHAAVLRFLIASPEFLEREAPALGEAFMHRAAASGLAPPGILAWWSLAHDPSTPAPLRHEALTRLQRWRTELLAPFGA